MAKSKKTTENIVSQPQKNRKSRTFRIVKHSIGVASSGSSTWSTYGEATAEVSGAQSFMLDGEKNRVCLDKNRSFSN